MLKAFKYKISPTEKQIVLLNKHIGSVRFLYNLALETKKYAYASGFTLNRYDLQVQLKELKKECVWLMEINSQSLQVVLMNLDAAYCRFFKGQNHPPKFKRKFDVGSFNVPQNVLLEGDKLIIPKFKSGIDVVLHRKIKGEIRQATISKTPTGKFFVSILCETGEKAKIKKSVNGKTTIGIDLGIKNFIVSSGGKEYSNPKFLQKAQAKLKFVQRKYSKHKGKKTKQRIALLHERVANKRKDFLHKVSTELIKSHDSLAIETLQVSNMLKNHKLAKSIQDAGWGMFVDFLKYKAEWYGVNLLEIGTFEPSSKTCSYCGSTNKDLILQDREWTCKCGAKLNRDINAAINIKNFALRNYLSAEHRLENHGQLPTLVGAITHEAKPSLVVR